MAWLKTSTNTEGHDTKHVAYRIEQDQHLQQLMFSYQVPVKPIYSGIPVFLGLCKDPTVSTLLQYLQVEVDDYKSYSYSDRADRNMKNKNKVDKLKSNYY